MFLGNRFFSLDVFLKGEEGEELEQVVEFQPPLTRQDLLVFSPLLSCRGSGVRGVERRRMRREVLTYFR